VCEQQLASQEVPFSTELVYEFNIHTCPQHSVSPEQFIGRRLNRMKIFSFKTSTQQKNYWCVLFSHEISHILSAESFFKVGGRFCQKKVFEQILVIINPDCYCIGMWD
jgi:hypothetical protein